MLDRRSWLFHFGAIKMGATGTRQAMQPETHQRFERWRHQMRPANTSAKIEGEAA